jgi:hypothetical protein
MRTFLSLPIVAALLCVLVAQLQPGLVWANDGGATSSSDTSEESPDTSDESPETSDESPETSDESPETSNESPEASDESSSTSRESSETLEDPPDTSPALLATPVLSLDRDALGRPFPDPRLLRRSQGMMALGISLTVGAGALAVVGLNMGTAIARGELLVGRQGQFIPLYLIAGGSALGFVGLPLASAGSQMRAQLLRKARGVEKLPRTVANESRYWNASLRAQYGRSLTISGGASLLMGTLVTVAVAGLVGTEQYDPRFWVAPVVAFGSAGAMIPAGMLMRKQALKDMEQVRDEVDPLRQPGGTLSRRAQPRFDLPRPRVSMTQDKSGKKQTVFGMSWSMTY